MDWRLLIVYITVINGGSLLCSEGLPSESNSSYSATDYVGTTSNTEDVTDYIGDVTVTDGITTVDGSNITPVTTSNVTDKSTSNIDEYSSSYSDVEYILGRISDTEDVTDYIGDVNDTDGNTTVNSSNITDETASNFDEYSSSYSNMDYILGRINDTEDVTDYIGDVTDTDGITTDDSSNTAPVTTSNDPENTSNFDNFSSTPGAISDPQTEDANNDPDSWSSYDDFDSNGTDYNNYSWYDFEKPKLDPDKYADFYQNNDTTTVATSNEPANFGNFNSTTDAASVNDQDNFTDSSNNTDENGLDQSSSYSYFDTNDTNEADYSWDWDDIIDTGVDPNLDDFLRSMGNGTGNGNEGTENVHYNNTSFLFNFSKTLHEPYVDTVEGNVPPWQYVIIIISTLLFVGSAVAWGLFVYKIKWQTMKKVAPRLIDGNY